MLRTRTARAALMTSVALLGVTGSAAAETTRLVDGSFIDATSDGRYVLYAADSGPRLLDRTAGTSIPLPAGAEELADRAPRVLIHDGDAYRVLDTTTGTIILATLDASTDPVAATKARLVRNGQSVIFQTSVGGTLRTLERDLSSATTKERLSGVEFLDASEDGHVVTWKRPLPPVFRPAGQQPLIGDPAEGVDGVAVGYRVDDAAPQVVSTTQWRQSLGEPFSVQCNQRTYSWEEIEPTGMEVVQNGAAPEYSFLLHRVDRFLVGGQPQENDRTIWLGADPTADYWAGGSTSSSIVDVTGDPVSAAYGWRVRYDLGGVLGRGHAHLVRENGESGDPVNFFELDDQLLDAGPRVLPINRGGGAVWDAVPPGGTRGVYLSETGESSGPSQRGWRPLPAVTDRVDGPAIKVAANYWNCPLPGAFEDYLTVAPQPGPSRRSLVTYQQVPDPGGVYSPRMTARVNWFGFTVWQRTFERPGTFPTPALPNGLPGFRLVTSVILNDGPPLVRSFPLEAVR